MPKFEIRKNMIEMYVLRKSVEHLQEKENRFLL